MLDELKTKITGKKKISQLTAEELQEILDNADDYDFEIIESVKRRLNIVNGLNEENERSKTKEEMLSEILENQKTANYYLESIKSSLKGIAFILWFTFICSIIGGLYYVYLISTLPKY